MISLQIKPSADCRYDLLSLGEIMLRLDPGDTSMADKAKVENSCATAASRAAVNG